MASVSQTPLSVSTTEAKFTIDNVSTGTFSSSVLYFEVGLPGNHSVIEQSFTISPKLASVSPVSGSIGGTLLTANVPGATVSDIVDILDSAGSSICESTTVTAYGVVTCKTLPQEIASTVLSVSHQGEVSPCVNTDLSLCTYEQLTDSAFPAIESITKTANTILFTGSNFEMVDFTVSASFFGVNATSVDVLGTEATATFDLGVPVVQGDVFPVLIFTKDALEYYAPSLTPLVNDLEITSSLSGLQCSFAGECSYEVTANGLASIVR